MRRIRGSGLLLVVIVAAAAVATGVGILVNLDSDKTTVEVSAGTTPVTTFRAVEPSPPESSRDLSDQQAPPPDTGRERLVVAGGAVLTVPGGWSVFDIDAHPDVQCQLFNHGPAVYVGIGPIDIDCAQPVPTTRPDPGIVARLASVDPSAGDVVDSGEPVRWGDLDGWMVEDGEILRMVFPEADLFLVQVNKASAPAEVESVLDTLRRAALLDIAQVGHGLFTEGAFSFIEVTGSGNEPIAEQAFGPADPIVFQVAVAEGPARIRAFQRGCPGACPSADNLDALDPIGLDCETTFDVGVSELVRVTVDGRRCEITQLEIPTTTPRRCLPDEVALAIDTDDQPDGALAITTNVENTGAALCEVVLDELNVAITDGEGHLLDVEGNPISTPAGAAALFPGEVLLIVFDWRNSCGDYPAVEFQVDITNLGSAEAGIRYPKCDPETDGTFELFPDLRIVGQQTEGQQPDGTCRIIIIERISYPYSSALEALATELEEMVLGSPFSEIAELSGLTASDFLPTLRTDTAVTFRLLVDRDHQWSIRSRHMGEGWGVDSITSCTA